MVQLRHKEREVLIMKTKAIDYIIEAIEVAASCEDCNLDCFQRFAEVRRIVGNYKNDGINPTYEEKVYCADTLESFCKMFNLNYYCLLERGLEKCDKEEKNHVG